MVTTEQVDKIFPALIKAQSEMGNAKKTSDNPYFKSKYADLSEIIEVSKSVLTDNGLGVIQSPGGTGNTVTITCRIIHTSGQWIEDAIAMNVTKTDPQSIGSAITYGRRYQLAALFNIAQEDDDGNGASGKNNEKAGTKPEPETGTPPAQKPSPELVTAKQAVIDYLNLDPCPFNDKWKEYADARCKANDLDGLQKCIENAKKNLKTMEGGQ
jgi:hypothetical protein